MAKLKFTENQVDEFVKLYNSGQSCTKIAKMYNTSAATISSALKKRNINVINRQNELHFNVDDVLKDYNKGDSLTVLAKRYKTTTSCLSKKLKAQNIEIVNRQNRTKFNENVFDIIDTEEKAY